MKKWQAFIISIVVILCDQISKYLVLFTLAPYQPKAILPVFNLMLAFNTGSAFSFLSHAGPWHHWLFIGFSVTMSIILCTWIIRLPTTAHLNLLALSLILGGAIGNLCDRIRLGHVIDFIQVYYKTFYWPVFNIADSAICVGAILLLFEMIWNESKIKPKSQH